MSWRVVVITKRCKLEYRLGCLVCRGEEKVKVYLAEISTLIIESTAVSLTAALLSELIKNKTDVVFCDEKHNPESQLNPLRCRFDGSGCVRKQIVWDQDIKRKVWTEIVRNKIMQQYGFLTDLGSERADLLAKYAEDISPGDIANREGLAAKVYFNTLFGLGFKRGSDNFINSALNYGYSILLSAFNREIVSQGYLMQLGLCHDNVFNDFNLGCDLMEPFRIIIDRFVFSLKAEIFNSDVKHSIVGIMNNKVRIGEKIYVLNDAVSIYSRSVFDAIDKRDIKMIKFYTKI